MNEAGQVKFKFVVLTSTSRDTSTLFNVGASLSDYSVKPSVSGVTLLLPTGTNATNVVIGVLAKNVDGCEAVVSVEDAAVVALRTPSLADLTLQLGITDSGGTDPGGVEEGSGTVAPTTRTPKPVDSSVVRAGLYAFTPACV